MLGAIATDLQKKKKKVRKLTKNNFLVDKLNLTDTLYECDVHSYDLNNFL